MSEQTKLKVSFLLNREMRNRTFAPDALERLSSFADVVNHSELPENMTASYMLENIADAQAAVTCWGTPMLTKDILDAAGNLRVIAHAAGTARAILDPAAWPDGLRIFTAAPIIAIDVAETALWAMIDLLKYMKEFDGGMRSGYWFADLSSLRHSTRRLNYRLTVGVVSASMVGRNMIRLLQSFGVKVWLYDPFVTAEQAGELGVVKVDLDTLMAQCDVVSVHAPNLPATQGMISAALIRSLKDGAVFINTSRGAIVDETALINELKTGRIRAYLDVFHQEPLPLESELYHLPGVRLSPHMSGGQTINGSFERGDYLVEQLHRFYTTGALLNEVTRERWDIMA